MKPAVRKQEFPLVPLQSWIWAIPVALWAVLLLIAFGFGSHQQSPDNPVPWWVVVVFGTALAPAGLVSMLAHREACILSDRLVLSGGLFFARKLQVGELAMDQARVLDLGEHTVFKPMLQLGAFSLPGFNVGNYMLRNRRRAFCLLTSRERVLLLPLHNGKLVIVSPEKPRALLDALASRQDSA